MMRQIVLFIRIGGDSEITVEKLSGYVLFIILFIH